MPAMNWSDLLARLRGSPGAERAPVVRVLMVCMGNICRSPTAEAVLRHKLAQAGLAEQVSVDSAGTHAYHVGSPPDERSSRHASRRGYALEHLRARRVEEADFNRFDLVLAMDDDNLALLRERCPREPAGLLDRVQLLVDFLPADSPLAGTPSVPDPYYGGPNGFEHVLDVVEAACEGLAGHLRQVVGSVASGTGAGEDPEGPGPR